MNTIYVKASNELAILLNALSNTIQVELWDISELMENRNTKIKYEVRNLDLNSEFNAELNFFIPNEILLAVGLYNNVLFGLTISRFFNDPILVHDYTDDPYQWLYIAKGSLYLADEIDSIENGININRESIRSLDISKVSELLPSKQDLIENRTESIAYWVSPSNKWADYLLR